MLFSACDSDATKKTGKAVMEAIKAGAPTVELNLLPDLTDMSPSSITANVHAINALCPNARQKFVFEKLVTHLHDFAREVSLTTEEWMAAIHFLTACDAMNHPAVASATEGTVLGPFFTEDAKELKIGESIASDGKGEYMWCQGRVLDIEGKPVSGCTIETWETDDEGLYDTQYEGRVEADCRGRLTSDENGNYAYRAILPTPYPIPNDGPVGGLLKALNRHVFRPAHLHMMFYCAGYETLITALYFKGDPYVKSDAVFGVKSSLIVDPVLINDESKAISLGFKHGPYWHLEKDYVLLTSAQAEEQKKKSLAAYYASLQ